MNRKELGQSLNLSVELIEEDKNNRSGGKITPDFITIHNTANTNSGADANAHSRFVRKKGHYVLRSGKIQNVSWHYTVDDRRVIKHLPISEKAYHAGKGNSLSIAIEICMHAEIDQQAANERAMRLVAVLMHDLGIPRSNIKPHKHWTGKNCPTLLLDTFSTFTRTCDDICSGLEEPISASALITGDEFSQVEAFRNEPIAETLGEKEYDFDPDEEHELIAAEVSNFVEPS